MRGDVGVGGGGRGGRDERASGGDHFRRGGFAPEAMDGGAAGTAAARRTRDEDGPMTGRDHGGSGRRHDGGAGGGHSDGSQPAVEAEARFVRQVDARGAMAVRSRSNASDARGGRGNCAPPDAPESGDGALIAQGYMRLAAMRNQGCAGGGGDNRKGGSSAPRGMPEADRSSVMFPYSADRSYGADYGADGAMAMAGPPPASIATPKRPAATSEVFSSSPSQPFRGGSSARLPPISQAIPDTRQLSPTAPRGGRSRSPSEDRARPLKKRRCGSAGSNPEAASSGRAAQVCVRGFLRLETLCCSEGKACFFQGCPR